MKKINNILFYIAIIITTIVMFVFIGQKNGWHEDEIFSYGSSNYKCDNLFLNFGDKDSLNQLIDEKIVGKNIGETLKNISYYLKNEDVILSLSTKEYEKMFDLPIIQLDFVIRNGHTFKRNAVYLKKARGMILNYLIEHHIEDIEQIKEIVIDDYHFSEDDSNDDHWVFIKNEKMKYIKK
mgnify:CR=1 FL=1